MSKKSEAIKKMEEAADLIFEANQLAVENNLPEIRSVSCYLCEKLETILGNLKENK